MDTDLQKLAGHLQSRGPHVALNDTGTLRAARPLDEHLTEQIAVDGSRYVTSFGYEMGGRGHEASCAERIAHPRSPYPDRPQKEGVMKAESRVKICIYCDRPIEGASIKVADASRVAAPSGARGDDYRHVQGDPACRPRGYRPAQATN